MLCHRNICVVAGSSVRLVVDDETEIFQIVSAVLQVVGYGLRRRHYQVEFFHHRSPDLGLRVAVDDPDLGPHKVLLEESAVLVSQRLGGSDHKYLLTAFQYACRDVKCHYSLSEAGGEDYESVPSETSFGHGYLVLSFFDLSGRYPGMGEIFHSVRE